jgi:hypothetical protein
VLLQLLLLFAVKYAIRKLQANKERLKLKGVHQLPVCANGVNLLSESAYYKANIGT